MVTQPVILRVVNVQKPLIGSADDDKSYRVFCMPEDEMGRALQEHSIFVYVGVGEGSLLYTAHQQMDKGSRIKMLVKLSVRSAIMMQNETWTYADGQVLGFWNVQR